MMRRITGYVCLKFYLIRYENIYRKRGLRKDCNPIAVEFNKVMNPLSNAWYLPEDER